jgi:hypothetical protein
MRPLILTLAACAAAAPSSMEHTKHTTTTTKATRDVFRELAVVGHRTHVSAVEKTDRKWLVFPDQQTAHREALAGPGAEAAGVEPLLLDASFWDRHASVLNLAPDARMSLREKWASPGGAIEHQKFEQYKLGVRVFGGDFVASVGAHGGVLRVNGLPVSAPAGAAELAQAQEAGISEQAVLGAVASRVHAAALPSDVTLSAPLELVWFNRLASAGKAGDLSLAYLVRGRVRQETVDAFVCARTGAVLHVINKSHQVAPPAPPRPPPPPSMAKHIQGKKIQAVVQAGGSASPFSDPLAADIVVIDDSNGDAIVFDSSASTAYPTGDAELDALVDNTLYMRNMMHSLSNGRMQSWGGADRTLQIEYKLVLDNAYFDGYDMI